MVWVQSQTESELHQSWISPGHRSGSHSVHYCQGLPGTARDCKDWLQPGERPGQGGGWSKAEYSLWMCEWACWFCIFAGDGSVKIISGLGARKYREIHNGNTKHTPTHFRGQHNRKHTFTYLLCIYWVALTIVLVLFSNALNAQLNNWCSDLLKLMELNTWDEREVEWIENAL